MLEQRRGTLVEVGAGVHRRRLDGLERSGCAARTRKKLVCEWIRSFEMLSFVVVDGGITSKTLPYLTLT